MPTETLSAETTAPSIRYSVNARCFCLMLAAQVVVLLFVLGAQPFAAGLFPEPWDKAAHFVAYGALAWLLWIGFDGRRPWLSILLVGVVGLLDELHQIGLPGRSADPADLLIDVIAALTVIGTLRAWRR